MPDRRDAAPPDGLSLFLRLENGAEPGNSGSPAGKPAIFLCEILKVARCRKKALKSGNRRRRIRHHYFFGRVIPWNFM